MENSSGKWAANLIPKSSLSDQLASEPILDRAIQERIGDHLRAMYDDLMQQPVPDRFVELLNRLKRGNEKGEH
jgi:hypothetical protein